MLTCSTNRPWGIHAAARSDEDCPRCGWTAPGALADAPAESLEATNDRDGAQGLAA